MNDNSDTTATSARTVHAVAPQPAAHARAGVPVVTSPGRSGMVALAHLSESLRTTYHDTPDVTWQQIAQCTLSAVQRVDPGSPPATDILQRRMVLNHALDRAFLARKNLATWKTYDVPTLVIAVEDLIAEERNHPV